MSSHALAATEDSEVMEAPSATAPKPDLNLRTLTDALPRRKGASTVVVSVILHVVALALLVAVPLLTSSTLPEPTSQVRAFLIEPPPIAAPPPPPPPAPRSAAARPVTQPNTQPSFVAPVETPETVVSEEGLDLGTDGGVPGGVEGGVEGGVAGGIIGGLPEDPLPPTTPVRVGGAIKEAKKLKHVPPEYPALAQRTGVQGTVIIEAVVGPDGRVQQATVLRGVPLLDQAALSAVKQWVYAPTLMHGVPVPVIMTVTVTFALAVR